MYQADCGPKGDRAKRRETRASRNARDDKILTLEGYVILEFQGLKISGWGKFYLQDASAKLQMQIAGVRGRLAQEIRVGRPYTRVFYRFFQVFRVMGEAATSFIRRAATGAPEGDMTQ